VPHFGAQTHGLDFSPLGFLAKKYTVLSRFLAGNSNSQKGNGIITPLQVIGLRENKFEQKIPHLVSMISKWFSETGNGII
jgi:hypothetical protein